MGVRLCRHGVRWPGGALFKPLKVQARLRMLEVLHIKESYTQMMWDVCTELTMARHPDAFRKYIDDLSDKALMESWNNVIKAVLLRLTGSSQTQKSQALYAAKRKAANPVHVEKPTPKVVAAPANPNKHPKKAIPAAQK